MLAAARGDAIAAPAWRAGEVVFSANGCVQGDAQRVE
jgi:hypothetical protein